MLNLFVIDAESGTKVPAVVTKATLKDLNETKNWQTNWNTRYALEMPNKVALRRMDNQELLGLMAYALDDVCLAVEIIYVESARHSNANLLRAENKAKKYIGIAKALFAHAAEISKKSGFDGVLIFKVKTSELVNYYIREFGACHAGSYDPFRLVIWEDAADDAGGPGFLCLFPFCVQAVSHHTIQSHASRI